jgi:hypothetical protein
MAGFTQQRRNLATITTPGPVDTADSSGETRLGASVTTADCLAVQTTKQVQRPDGTWVNVAYALDCGPDAVFPEGCTVTLDVAPGETFAVKATKGEANAFGRLARLLVYVG